MNNLRIGESKSATPAALSRGQASSWSHHRATRNGSSENPVPPPPVRASIARLRAVEAKIRAYANSSH
jgi:hypothetical protein